MHFLSSRAITDDVEQERFVKNGDEVSNIFGGTGRIVDRLATKSITEMYICSRYPTDRLGAYATDSLYSNK